MHSEDNIEFKPTVSIIINNYNYDQFLAKAIDSALNQTYPSVEVIVVDDGSTDQSCEIISSYGSNIIPVLKVNGGQNSCLNEGFKASSGDVIFFLDSDDLFHQQKVEKIINFLNQSNLIDSPIAFHNMSEAVNESGLPEKTFDPSKVLHEDWNLLSIIKGNTLFFNGEVSQVCTSDQVYERFASKYRYVPYIGMQTSCISITRVMAEKVFPLPIPEGRFLGDHADTFITKASSLIGSVYSSNLVLTQYRVHDNNWHRKKESQEKRELINQMQDDFLNAKLKSLKKEPVIAFSRSMNASSFYRCYFGYEGGDKLLNLAFDVVKWHTDTNTLKFFLVNFARGIYYKFKIFYRNFLFCKPESKN